MASVTARTASVFRSSAFSRFYAGQALSYLGDGLRTLAIPLLVFRLTGSAAAIGWTWGLEYAPYALVSVVGGSLADRVDRRRLMLVCDAVRFVVMALFCVLFATGRLTIGMIYAGVVLLAVAGSIFLGSQTPTLPYLLGKERAKPAIAALFATEQTVNLISPPIGGALMGVFGPLPALAANAFTYLCSQVSIASVRTFGPDEPQGMPAFREIARDVATGWRFLWADPALRAASIASFFLNGVGSIGFVALIPYYKRAFGASDVAVGIAFGCFSAGAALGAYLGGRTHWRIGRAMIVANVIDGLAWLPLAWAASMPVAVASVAISSACAGYYVTTLVSWRMRVITEDLVGRVFGVAKFIVLIGVLPGALLGGWLADHVGVRPTMAIEAFGFLACSLMMCTSRAIREERR